MLPPRETVAANGGPALPAPVSRAVLWSGAALCVAGFIATRMWEHWAPGRFLELIALALASGLLAWPLQRWAHWAWASALAAVWCAASVLFASVLPVMAAALFALAALALGSLVARDLPMALRCACGLALFGGALGWLLPLTLHSRWTYLALCLLPIALMWRPLLADLRAMRGAWSAAVSEQPRAAAFAVLALGLASTGGWLPTMQFDDLAYHVGLPWQLLESGRYAFDPASQVWALAPWAGDVQHAVVQLLAGAEARGPLNALWIAITAAGVWRMCAALGGSARCAWTATALYASLPLTAGLAGGMQTETATAALLAWLGWLIASRAHAGGPGALRAGAVLVGGLVGLKLMAAACAVVMVGWAAAARRPFPGPASLLIALALVVCVGCSSYVYAAIMAGNPFLPLFNGWFQSPYFEAANFDDPRWHAGLSPLLTWQLTFHTKTYSEGFAGGAGFVLVGLMGAWMLALLRRRTRGAAIAAGALLLLPLLPLQYLRYAFPGLVLLLPIAAVATEAVDSRRGMALLMGLAVFNFAFQANADWMLRTGALKQTVLALGTDQPLFEEYVPERLLIERMRTAAPDDGAPESKVLLMQGTRPRQAELGTHGRTVAWYAPRLQSLAARADADPAGLRWQALWRSEGITDVIVVAPGAIPARAAALARTGATLQQREGDAEWWRLPESTP